MRESHRVFKSGNGLLPIQNECALLFCPVWKALGIALFPDEESKQSLLENRESTLDYARAKVDEMCQEYSSVDLTVARSFLSVFCDELSREDIDFDKLQVLFREAVDELSDALISAKGSQRWNAFMLEAVANDAVIASIEAACFAFRRRCVSDNESFRKASLTLGTICRMLLGTSFSEQISLASYDLAIGQAQINRSLRRIAIASMVVAILAFIMSVVPVVVPWVYRFMDLA